MNKKAEIGYCLGDRYSDKLKDLQGAYCVVGPPHRYAADRVPPFDQIPAKLIWDLFEDDLDRGELAEMLAYKNTYGVTVGNEPCAGDPWKVDPKYAVYIAEKQVALVDELRPGTFKWLAVGHQLEAPENPWHHLPPDDPQYRPVWLDLVWPTLPEPTKQALNGMQMHFYTESWPPARDRNALLGRTRTAKAQQQVIDWMNANGVSDRDLIIGEIGLDAGRERDDSAIGYIARLRQMVLAKVRIILWYAAVGVDYAGGWASLIRPDPLTGEDALTCGGHAFRALKRG